jgi:hypothetical protein
MEWNVCQRTLGSCIDCDLDWVKNVHEKAREIAFSLLHFAFFSLCGGEQARKSSSVDCSVSGMYT